MSELDSHEVRELSYAATLFDYAYKQYQLHPESGRARTRALAALGTLEQAVKDHVSRETLRMKEMLDDGDQEPPF